MTLPEPQYGKYNILKPGKYTCKITEKPKEREFKSRTGIILRFDAKSHADESVTEASTILWTWPDRDTGFFPYIILRDKVIKSKEEADWVGKIFVAEFEVGPHPTKSSQKQHKIVHIEYEGEDEEEPPLAPEPEREPGEDEEDLPF